MVAECFKHAWLDDGVLIKRGDPLTTECLSLAEELVQRSGDTKILGVLDENSAFGDGADVVDVLRAVIDEDQGRALGGFQVLLQAGDIGLVGDDANGVIHILICLSGEKSFERLNDARLIDLVLKDDGIDHKQQDAHEDPKHG